jgi:trimethylamine---corrinoid protein Co-methyltransferase
VKDEQTGYEKVMTFLLPALAGANLIYGMGMLESGMTLDFAQMVIDDEIATMVKRVVRGIGVSDEMLAVDLIKKLGPGSDYLGQKHTRLHQHEELVKPRLTDRRMRGAWERRGSKSMVDSARERALEILGNHKPLPLDPEVSRKIEGIIADARAELDERNERVRKESGVT